MLSRHGERFPDKKEIIKMELYLKNIRDALLKLGKRLNYFKFSRINFFFFFFQFFLNFNFNFKGKNNKWLCERDLKRLREWKFGMSASDDVQLTRKGRATISNLGKRMRKRLDEVINATNLSLINVQVTYQDRTRQSAEEFLAGMFNDTPVNHRPLIRINSKDDYLLKYPDMCDKFQSVS